MRSNEWLGLVSGEPRTPGSGFCCPRKSWIPSFSIHAMFFNRETQVDVSTARCPNADPRQSGRTNRIFRRCEGCFYRTRSIFPYHRWFRICKYHGQSSSIEFLKHNGLWVSCSPIFRNLRLLFGEGCSPGQFIAEQDAVAVLPLLALVGN